MRRLLALMAGLAVLAVGWPGAPATAQPRITLGGPPLPATGAYWGAYAKWPDESHGALDRRSATTLLESQVGRQLGLDRQYYRWDDQWPNADDEWSRDAGRTLLLSWNAGRNDGTFAKWADIAAGVYDADIHTKAAAIKAFGAPIFFAFNHEPGTNGPGGMNGTPQDFIDAWRHIHDVFDADGVTNISYVLVLMAITYKNQLAEQWYPGDAYVDLVGADGYNWYKCGGPWEDFTKIFNGFHAFAISKGKPMIVAEWGTGEDPDVIGRKADWITDGANVVKSWPEVKGISYFHVDNVKLCIRFVDTSAESLAAFRAMGADPYFNPTFGPTTTITSGPADPTTLTTATFAFTPSYGPSTFQCALDAGAYASCVSPKSYSNLVLGTHTFSVKATDGSGTTGSPATWTWTIIAGASVSVRDFVFTPKTANLATAGGATTWTFNGPSLHTATDSSGMGLFDSGSQGVGGTYSFTFVGAGVYQYLCTFHPSMTAQVKVPMTVAPPTGNVATVFTVTWASGTAPTGYVYDVQIKRPGSNWSGWKLLQTAASATFTADRGTGTYSFRSRLRRISNNRASGYSAPVSLTVT